jgi:hypothetical protein
MGLAMKHLRMYLRAAEENGFPQHPQEVMKILGIKYTKYHPEPMADAWFFEVDNDQKIPNWIDVLGSKYDWP